MRLPACDSSLGQQMLWSPLGIRGGVHVPHASVEPARLANRQSLLASPRPQVGEKRTVCSSTKFVEGLSATSRGRNQSIHWPLKPGNHSPPERHPGLDEEEKCDPAQEPQDKGGAVKPPMAKRVNDRRKVIRLLCPIEQLKSES